MGVNIHKPVKVVKNYQVQSKHLLEEEYQLTRSKLDLDLSYMFKDPSIMNDKRHAKAAE